MKLAQFWFLSGPNWWKFRRVLLHLDYCFDVKSWEPYFSLRVAPLLHKSHPVENGLGPVLCQFKWTTTLLQWGLISFTKYICACCNCESPLSCITLRTVWTSASTYLPGEKASPTSCLAVPWLITDLSRSTLLLCNKPWPNLSLYFPLHPYQILSNTNFIGAAIFRYLHLLSHRKGKVWAWFYFLLYLV